MPCPPLSKEQRDKLPLSDFADPDRRLFPIIDQDDVDSAAHLIGKAKNPEQVKARIKAIAKRKGLSLPDAWKASASMGAPGRVPIRFDLKASARIVEGDYAIYPNSLVWVAGDYPDKSYAMTPEENWLAVDNFTPVSGNIEHTDFLAGRACQVHSIRLDAEDPWRIRARIAVPLALDTLLGPQERGLSCEWDRATKLLEGLALTTSPRISEAALMNDTALADYAAREDSPIPALMAWFAGKRHNTADMAAIQQIHDLAANQGAACKELGPILDAGDPVVRENGPTLYSRSTGAGGTRRMGSSRNRFLNWFHAGRDLRDAARDAGAQLEDEAEFAVVEDVAEAAAAEARAEELRKAQTDRDEARRERDLARQETFKARADRLQGEAAAFADGLIAGSKIFPGEREGVIALYTQAGMDDAEHGQAAFSGAAGGSRVDALKATYTARPAHSLTREQLNPGEGNGLRLVPGAGPTSRKADFTAPTPEGEEPSAERIKHLVSLAGGTQKEA